jgi:hypothetical protein
MGVIGMDKSVDDDFPENCQVDAPDILSPEVRDLYSPGGMFPMKIT